MSLLQEQVKKLVDLSSNLLDMAISMQDIVEPRKNYWHGVFMSPEEVQARRTAALARFRQKYEVECGDDALFQAGYADIVRGLKRCRNGEKQQQQDLPVESYYTVYPARRMEEERLNGVVEETDSGYVSLAEEEEDQIDIDELPPPDKRQKLGD